MIRNITIIALFFFLSSLSFAQDFKVTGISKISVYATFAKGTPANQIFEMPELITPDALKFETKEKKKLFKTQPPRSIDTILDLTENLFSQYLKHNLQDQELPGDIYLYEATKNKLPGLPNIKTNLILGEKADGKGGLDEAIEVDCNWSIAVIDGKWFKPTLYFKAELYENANAPVWKRELTIPSEELDYTVMKEFFKVTIDPSKGFSKDFVKKNGIPGNMLVDAYHKGLERLLKMPDPNQN